jgi:hypothetical protein
VLHVYLDAGRKLAPVRLMLGERYGFEAVRGDRGWRLSTIEVARLWSTQPVAAGALVTELNRAP